MSTPKPHLKLLHTADNHIGLDVDPARAERAFRAVIAAALAEGVDGLIIAGDLFDHNRVTDAEVEFAAAEIARLSVPVIVLPGNHDQYDATSVHHRHHLPDLAPNVHMVTTVEGALLHIDELHTTFWGRPVVDHCPEFQPLAGAPERQNGGWHVALAHGFHIERGEQTYRSSPIRAEEIAALGWDYLAMGHVHRYADLSEGVTRACFPGSSFSLAEDYGSAALVTLDPIGGVTMEKYPLAAVAAAR